MSQFEFQPLETSGVVAGSEGVAAQQLNEATFEPRAYVEQSGMIEQAEAIEDNLTTLIENAIGPAARASSSGGIAGSGLDQIGITPINLPREADLASSSGGVAGSGAEQVGITPINLPREANFASGAKGPGGDPAGDVASGAVKGPGGDGVANGGVRTPSGGDPVATSVEGGNATITGETGSKGVTAPFVPGGEKTYMPGPTGGISWKVGGGTPVPLNPPDSVEGGNAMSAKGDKISGEIAVPLRAPASVEGGNATSITERIGEVPTPIPSPWEGFSDKTTGEIQVPLRSPASVEGGNAISWKWGGDTPVPLNPPASVESGNAGRIEAIGASQLVNSLGLRLNIAFDTGNQIEGRVGTNVEVYKNDNTDIPGDLTSQTQLELQQLMEKKTQIESNLSNILKNFDQTQSDLVANLK
jgi:hypothetical protein